MNIKAPIGASVQRVEAGSRLVADAGSTMADIVGQVRRVADLIGEISAATGSLSPMHRTPAVPPLRPALHGGALPARGRTAPAQAEEEWESF